MQRGHHSFEVVRSAYRPFKAIRFPVGNGDSLESGATHELHHGFLKGSVLWYIWKIAFHILWKVFTAFGIFELS